MVSNRARKRGSAKILRGNKEDGIEKTMIKRTITLGLGIYAVKTS